MPKTVDFDAIPLERLRGIRRGIEKESLRTSLSGELAASPHPARLGSALTHPRITTDFSEAQVELITGAHISARDCLAELSNVQQFVLRALDDELLWVSSMPCRLPPDEAIPIGQYGASNVGRTKSLYRVGLGHRYGRRMQTISGIHYNWSLPEVSNDGYFALIRNFRRHVFLLLYLFGASPAVCSSFVAGRAHALQPLGRDSMSLPYATSLRMGRLGYQSDAQTTLAVSYNNLESYAASLESALTTPYPPYEAIGVRGEDGEYRQLSSSILQIENEFYGTIRPKRSIFQGERPLHALRERGVEYVEVRVMDLNPFEPVGISRDTMCFLDVFLLHCLLSDSPPDTPEEILALTRNQRRVAERGREPGLVLESRAGDITLVDWGRALLAELAPLAQRLDEANDCSDYSAAINGASAAFAAPERLPSARVLHEMAAAHDNSFLDFSLAASKALRDSALAQPVDAAVFAELEAQAQASLDKQQSVEAADVLPFDQYLQEYLDPSSLALSCGGKVCDFKAKLRACC